MHCNDAHPFFNLIYKVLQETNLFRFLKKLKKELRAFHLKAVKNPEIRIGYISNSKSFKND